MKKLKLDWNEAYNIEARLAEILAEQEQHGWLINVEKANKLVDWLQSEEKRISDMLLNHFPLVIENQGELKSIFKINGEYSHYVKNWCISNGLYSWLDTNIISAPFTRVDFQPPNLASQDQVKDVLYSLGWVPDEWNFKKDKRGKPIRGDDGEFIQTSPKITESSLDAMPELEDGWGKELITLLKIQARLKFFGDSDEGKGLLSHLRSDGTIPSEVVQCATNTSRGQHRKIANVPRPGSFLGKESRDLFICHEGNLLVGTDYSALESNMIAHAIYMYTLATTGKGDTRFAELIASVDDIHTYLWDGLRDLVSCRALCKNINFALPYGAQASKLGKLCDIKPEGMSNKQAGEIVLEVLREKFPGLIEARDAASNQAKEKGYVLGLDGRKNYCRSPHSAFNTKCQAWGSQLVKKGMILHHEYLKKANIPSVQIGWFHDEWTREQEEKYVEEVKYLALKAVNDSGHYYNIITEMAGTSKSGKSWLEIH